jgi:hypothetical protein
MPEKREVVPEELDFRCVPQAEIEACYIYEYARELTMRTPKLVALFKRWCAGTSAEKGTRRFSNGLRAYRKFRKIMTACFPDFPVITEKWFPETTWRKMDDAVRAQLVKEVNGGPDHRWHGVSRHKLCIEPFKFEENIANGEWKHIPQPFRDEDINEVERGTFIVNWNYPPSTIKKAFEEWLEEQVADRKKRGLTQPKYKPKGRGSFRDQLNWLAGLRVKQRYRKEELVDDTGYRLKATVPRPYSNYPELCEGAQKADRVLALFARRAR